MGWIPHSSTYCQTRVGYWSSYVRPRAGDAYLFVGSPRYVSPGAWVSAPGQREREEGQTGGKISSDHTNRRVEK
jgi:hypothetical protein